MSGCPAACLGRATRHVTDATHDPARADLSRVLDLGQPAALVLGAVPRFIGDADDPAGVVGRLLAPLSVFTGSHLVISQP
jgi:S-adenosyl methyltransferase